MPLRSRKLDRSAGAGDLAVVNDAAPASPIRSQRVTELISGTDKTPPSRFPHRAATIKPVMGGTPPRSRCRIFQANQTRKKIPIAPVLPSRWINRLDPRVLPHPNP